MTFLIADGIVPSNEERGYILRRVMRRAIQQGRRIGIEGLFLPTFVEQVIDVMGPAYPELVEGRAAILGWVRGEEEGFGRTLEQGSKLLEEILDSGQLGAEDAFRLHDTFGFPIELTRELAAERGVPFTGDEEFEQLMGEQRARSSAAAGEKKVGAGGSAVSALDAGATEFVGYENLSLSTRVSAAGEEDGRPVLKLESSPFYAEGGGQVGDSGRLLDEGGGELATVTAVLRAGDDQALVIEPASGARLEPGATVIAEVDRMARHATECNHTATHLLHAALRRALGDHVRQAGSYVGPDKLRFDFTHSGRLTDEERRRVEDEVNERVLADLPVGWRTVSMDDARELGAMALFGEKYGDVVRMVEIDGGESSRELCGGTHVSRTSEIGAFRILSEGSSAANVRRIEAVTGPAAITMLLEHDRLLGEASSELRVPPEQLPRAVAGLRQEARRAAPSPGAGVDAAELAAGATEIGSVKLVVSEVKDVPAKPLVELADRVKGAAGGECVVVLGSVEDGRVHLVVAVDPEVVERGVRAGEVVSAAAAKVGGGGGGRDTMAQAGGRNPEALPDALQVAEEIVAGTLGS